MKTSYVKTTICLLASALMLTGCGSSMPNMTAEQEQAVGEYAAMLLLKYDAGNRSRLVDLPEMPEEESEESAENTQQAEQQEPPQTQEAPVEETPEAENVQEAPLGSISGMEEFLGLPEGMTLVYQGAHTTQSYPEGENATEYFSLDAMEGKSLLVLSFSIVNETGGDCAVDLLSGNVRYSVTVNGDSTRNALPTMLMNDMSAYSGTIPAAEAAEVVLIAEMNRENLQDISSVSLKMKSESATYTIQLQ